MIGVIDALFLEGGKWVLVEFKTDWISNKDAFRRLWKEKDERTLVQKIYNYVKNEWKNFEGTPSRQADLILCGQGISRLDVPVLYIQSMKHKVDKPENIFYTFCKTKQVDLSNVAIPLIYADVLYPSNWNLICKRFRIDRLKESGKSVWLSYDDEDYASIEKRTEGEVLDCFNFYDYIQKNWMTRKKR